MKNTDKLTLLEFKTLMIQLYMSKDKELPSKIKITVWYKMLGNIPRDDLISAFNKVAEIPNNYCNAGLILQEAGMNPIENAKIAWQDCFDAAFDSKRIIDKKTREYLLPYGIDSIRKGNNVALRTIENHFTTRFIMREKRERQKIIDLDNTDKLMELIDGQTDK